MLRRMPPRCCATFPGEPVSDRDDISTFWLVDWQRGLAGLVVVPVIVVASMFRAHPVPWWFGLLIMVLAFKVERLSLSKRRPHEITRWGVWGTLPRRHRDRFTSCRAGAYSMVVMNDGRDDWYLHFYSREQAIAIVEWANRGAANLWPTVDANSKDTPIH